MPGLLKYYYDKLVFSSGTEYAFFDSIGSSYLVNNLDKAGEIDENKSFDIHSLRFYFAGVSKSGLGWDAYRIVKFLEGIITLFVGGDPMLRLPAWMCPGGGGPVAQMYDDDKSMGFVTNGAPDPRQVLILDPPVTIPTGTSFKVTLNFSADPGLTSAAPFMWMVLGGREY